MGGKAARRKGFAFERFVANTLKIIFPNARRQLEYHVSDCNGVDIQETGHYRVQCKKLKRYAPINCIKEVQIPKGVAAIPVLVTAGDGEEPMAVIPYEHFLRLLRCEQIAEKTVENL